MSILYAKILPAPGNALRRAIGARLSMLPHQASAAAPCAVNHGMPALRLDRCGTAAIEFALVAPIMALLAVGLADTVQRTLATIDVEAAASAGALAARRHAEDPRRITAAIAAVDPAAVATITLIDCKIARSHPCAHLPDGRYARVTTARHLPSLFGPARDPAIVATALVRLP